MTEEIINIKELKDDINGFLFKIDCIGLKELQKSNELIEYWGEFVNETVKNYNAL